MLCIAFSFWVIFLKAENKYINSAFLMLMTSVIVKVISAVYKIPLTAFIGVVGRGYFAAAYNVYLPLHAVLMGSFPIAVSRLVSKYNALNDKKRLSSVKRGSGLVLAAAGFTGMAVMLLAAKPYAHYVASSPKSVYTVYVLAPSLLFSCLAASYRGYFEGFMDMKPTSVSQTLEALIKTVFGLLFSKLAMMYMLKSYAASGTVFGTAFAGEEEALSFIYPFTSAAAMLGVSFGSVVSCIYVVIYYLINRDKSLPIVSGKQGRRELCAFSFPIMFSCAVQSFFQFLDTASVQFSLGRLPLNELETLYPYTAQIAKGDVVTYVFGIYSAALDFKNLVPGITMALGICAVPAICGEYEAKNAEKLKSLMNSIYKYTSVLSCFGGIFISLAAKDILSLFYSSSPDIIQGCTPVVTAFGYTVMLYSLASTAVFCVQAVGKPELSVKPYIISGIIRTALNYILIRYTELALLGTVVSGAAGYFLLFVMNARIARRVSGVKFDIKNIVIKPLFVSFFAYFISVFVTVFIKTGDNLIFNLLIKLALFGGIYCILCFFVKLLNFKQIFCVLKYKKMA